MNTPTIPTTLFKTPLPENFSIIVDQNSGTHLQITPDLTYSNNLSCKEGLDTALIDWLNHEFSDNPKAQLRLREIKTHGVFNSGHVAIVFKTQFQVVSIDLFHTMCVISSMGYDIHSNIDLNTKKVKSFSLNKIK